MPKIEILEKDLTTPGVVSESTDIVYIPGFVDTEQSCLQSNGKYIGLEYHKPVLFNSVAEFVALCGKKPVTFEEDQLYSDLTKIVKVKVEEDGEEKDEVVELFPSSSHDVSDVMFEADMADPAYIMAKELLASGISVMYERINEDYDAQNPGYVAFPDAAKSDTIYYKNAQGEYVEYAAHEKDGKPETSNVKAVSVFDVDHDNGTDAYQLCTDGEYRKQGTATNAIQGVLYQFSDVTSIDKWDKTTCVNYAYVKRQLVAGTDDVIEEHFFKYNVPGIDIANCYRMLGISDILNIKTVYNELATVFDTSNPEGIVDKGNFSIKYVTSGGYPTYEYDSGSLVVKMLNFAETRGDCVALIDHTDYLDRELNPVKVDSLFKSVNNSRGIFTDSGEYGAMFTPWATYNRTTSDYKTETYKKYEGTSLEKEESRDTVLTSTTQLRAPGSFAYLMSLADSIKTNANWMAVAGVTRGKVRNLASDGMTTVIPNGVADAMQPRYNSVTVNAITNIAPYGYTIWGNRTLKPVEENLVATNFLNIRNLVSDIKKTCYRVARKTTFEQNTDILWVNFSSEIGKLLERMKSGFGISGYKIVKDTEHEKAAEKATLCAKIIIYPTYAVEDFYITVVLKDDEVVVK